MRMFRILWKTTCTIPVLATTTQLIGHDYPSMIFSTGRSKNEDRRTYRYIWIRGKR
jgi:hypothetical protein